LLLSKLPSKLPASSSSERTTVALECGCRSQQVPHERLSRRHVQRREGASLDAMMPDLTQDMMDRHPHRSMITKTNVAPVPVCGCWPTTRPPPRSPSPS